MLYLCWVLYYTCNINFFNPKIDSVEEFKKHWSLPKLCQVMSFDILGRNVPVLGRLFARSMPCKAAVLTPFYNHLQTLKFAATAFRALTPWFPKGILNNSNKILPRGLFPTHICGAKKYTKELKHVTQTK